MHVFAYWTVASFANANLASDTATLVGITGSLVLSWSLLLSPGMESVTRAFYSRSDLDLVLTSPASARKVFAVRMGRIAVASVAIAVLLAAPGGSRWLSAYGVVAAMGAVATAAALSLTVALFRIIGAKRTRLIAQIVAAVIGAAFVILLQIAAIFSAGSLSRFAALQSQWMLSHAPDTPRNASCGAKIEAVIGMIALVFAPIVAVLTLDTVFAGIVCGLGILTAAAAATVIQLCFRVQARRIATFAEAFSSIAWAATTALVAAQTWAALGTAAIALGILAGVWLISPSRT
jgi:hypothetical protein